VHYPSSLMAPLSHITLVPDDRMLHATDRPQWRRNAYGRCQAAESVAGFVQ